MSDVKIVFIIGGKEIETTMSEYESVLEAALKAQIGPPYSCLEGVCGTCSAYLEEGEVDSIEGRVHNQSTIRTFKTCMAQPKSKFLRVNYDKADT
jgi:ferredoxin